MEIIKENKELLSDKYNSNQNHSSQLNLKSVIPEYKNNRVVLSIDIKLSDNNIQKIEINSGDEIENKINLFCKDNNISLNTKKYINNIILEELNKNIVKCKFYFI